MRDDAAVSQETIVIRSFFVASDSRGMYKQTGTLPVLRPGNVPDQSTS
jgi:hypothetical protein